MRQTNRNRLWVGGMGRRDQRADRVADTAVAFKIGPRSRRWAGIAGIATARRSSNRKCAPTPTTWPTTCCNTVGTTSLSTSAGMSATKTTIRTTSRIRSINYDANGRLQPAINRFPSANGGGGGISASSRWPTTCTAKGLKFGIHLMRGINQDVWERGSCRSRIRPTRPEISTQHLDQWRHRHRGHVAA